MVWPRLLEIIASLVIFFNVHSPLLCAVSLSPYDLMSESYLLGCVLFVGHHSCSRDTGIRKKKRQPSYQGLPPAEASYVRSAVIFIFSLYTGLLKLGLDC